MYKKKKLDARYVDHVHAQAIDAMIMVMKNNTNDQRKPKKGRLHKWRAE